MSELLEVCRSLLSSARIDTRRAATAADKEYLAFEGQTVIGFVMAYPTAVSLIRNWRSDFEEVVRESRVALIASKGKAWNIYSILLAQEPPSYNEKVALSAIEEDLVSARKIARAGIQTSDDAVSALLPLLPMQNSPLLEAVDIPAEIRLRTSELPPTFVQAFLSDASLAIVEQVLEEQK